MMNRSLIDFVLRYRNELRAAIKEEKENRDVQKVGGNGSGHCRISDPTAQKAIRHLSLVDVVKVYYGPSLNGQRSCRVIHDAEKWLSVSDATWKYFSEKRAGRFMQLKYSESADIKEVRKELEIGRRKFFYLLKDVRYYAYRAAKGMHIASADARKYFSRTEEIVNLLKKENHTDGC